MKNTIINPILKGFNPDPCICRVDEDYYIATSTFQWFPGVQIFHSRDMIHWKLYCRPLDNINLLNLIGVPDSGGVWAPCLTYNNGLFYLVYSVVKTFSKYFKDVDNYLITTYDLKGQWSEPVYLNSSGFDASLFHDIDGKKYILNPLFNHRDRNNQFDGILIQEYSSDRKMLIGEPYNIFKGTSLGITEGPHMYRIDGYYYLFCAEGGTFYEHAVTVARSKNLYGPYDVSPYHPLLTSYGHDELILQKSGHGSLVQTQKGDWYLAHLCARPNGNQNRCMLGRETAIQKLTKTEDGWFKLENGKNTPDVQVTGPLLKEDLMTEKEEYRIYFDGKLPDCFQTLRQPATERWLTFDKDNGWLKLLGKESMESLHYQSLIGRRREDFSFVSETLINFNPVTYQQIAGLTLYYDTTNYIYLYITYDEKLGKCIGLLDCNHGKHTYISDKYKLPENEDVYLRMNINNDKGTFSWSLDGLEFNKIGSEVDVTHLSDDYYDDQTTGIRFTGTFIALCCQDLSGRKAPAVFKYFTYNSGLE